MKAFYYLISLIALSACKTPISNTISSEENRTMEQVENKTTGCPAEGTCSIVVHKNKRLVLKEDGIGATYPEIVEGTGTVVEFNYVKKGPPGTADGDYSETIHFELAAASKKLNLENGSLKDVNLLYGKHCFCRGEAGYYPVTNGKLYVEKDNGAITFNLNFTIEKTSQVVSHISGTVKI